MTDHNDSNNPEPIDPIAAAWAQQDLTADDPALTSEPFELADQAAKAHRKDQWKLLWLNVQEVVPSLVVAAAFSSNMPDAERPLAVLASALLVLAVGGYLAITSIRHHRADRRWGTSVRDQVARRLAQVKHRARLYRSVAWWYFLPLVVAISLFRFGIGDPFTFFEELAFWGFLAGFSVVMYFVNRWYGRTRFESKVEQLEGLLAEFDDDLSTDMDDPTPDPESRDS